MSMNALIVYYSLSGTTRAVATAPAQEIAAGTEEIRCGRYTASVWGYLRASYDSWSGNRPSIEPLPRAHSAYELVIVCGPIWASHLATPVRTYLRQEAARLPDTAFVLTHVIRQGIPHCRIEAQRHFATAHQLG
jgi:menaquinone-dependent protoporphyrinogen IX oxidase